MRRFQHRSEILVLTASLALAPIAAGADHKSPPRKKLIQTGWDMPTPRQVREHLAEMEKRPFDGLVINLSPAFQSAHESRAWKREDFREPVEDLKACKFTRFTDNFIMLNANPGNVDFFDDAGWAHVLDHWRIAAWAARQAGIRGILFDPEPYAPPFAQFQYSAQPQQAQHTFADYAAKARLRGQEVMRTVAAEYPDITILSYFWVSYAAPAFTAHRGSASAHQPDPRLTLATQPYGLLPAFLDGCLDAAPPGVTLVDGDERGYRYNDHTTYLEAALQIKTEFQRFISPENRAKYRAQVQAGSGLYLDAYVNPPTSPWYIDGKGGPRTRRLAENVASALHAADEYVWIYGEQGRWWPTGRSEFKYWPEILPACDVILDTARDPVGAARTQVEQMQRSGQPENLMKNADFSAGPAAAGGPPAEWSAWQHEASRGKFEWDAAVGQGSARATGVSSGCFIQSHDARPGERCFISARAKATGGSEPTLRVRWETADHKWTAEDRDVMLYRSAPGAEGWSEIAGVATVPESAGRIVLLLGAAGKGQPDETAWFDEVRLYRLP